MRFSALPADLRVSSTCLARALAITAIAISASVLSGCNTTEGVGKDVKNLGASVEDAAQDAND